MLSLVARQYVEEVMGVTEFKVEKTCLPCNVLGRYDRSLPGFIFVNAEKFDMMDQIEKDMVIIHELQHLKQFEEKSFFHFGKDDSCADYFITLDTMRKHRDLFDPKFSMVECDAEMAVCYYLWSIEDFSRAKVELYKILSNKDKNLITECIRGLESFGHFHKMEVPNDFFVLIDQILEIC